jgi:hypothetical protein
MEDARSRRAVEVAEAFAEGVATRAQLKAARSAAQAAEKKESEGPVSHIYAKMFACMVTEDSAEEAMSVCDRVAYQRKREEAPDEEAVQAQILRDLCGNPHVTTRLDPAWLRWNDGTVVKLAKKAYEKRDYDLLPMIADALEDAGCNQEYLLHHCRSSEPHVRGCWALDLLLDKE